MLQEETITGTMTDTGHKRRPWVALAMSTVMPGLGQIYCGRIIRGLVFTFLSLIPVLILQSGLALGFDIVGPVVLIFALLATLIVPIVAITDSWYLAKHTRPDFSLKDYNRWYVYLLLVLMETSGSLGVAFNVRANYVEAFRIPTASMYPTLVPEDRFIANKTAYEMDQPVRGDIIVFRNPEDRHVRFVKRIIALGGDRVGIREGKVYVNDQTLERTNISTDVLERIPVQIEGRPVSGQVFEETCDGRTYTVLLGEEMKDLAEVEVPKGHCFVLGDNRNYSHDSRDFGSIPLADVIGRVEYLYCPARDWSRFGKLTRR